MTELKIITHNYVIFYSNLNSEHECIFILEKC